MRRREAAPGAKRVDLRRAGWAATGALLAAIAVSFSGGTHAHELRQRLIAFGASALFAILGLLAVRSASDELAATVSVRGGPGAASVARLLAAVIGYLLVLVTTLGLLAVPVQRLLLSGAITGVILGIAAQQSLANLFAGVVLMVSRPFQIGQRIVVYSGALGGTYEGLVRSIGLTYTTLETKDGPLNLPNAGLMAAVTGPRQPPEDGPAHGVEGHE